MKLSEFDFEVQHRPGSKHINADVLSCHFSAAVHKDEVLKGSIEGDGETEVIVKHNVKTNFANKLYAL
jgi:hypothetical protein